MLLPLGPLLVVPLGIGLLRPQALWICLASPLAAAAIVLRGLSEKSSFGCGCARGNMAVGSTGCGGSALLAMDRETRNQTLQYCLPNAPGRTDGALCCCRLARRRHHAHRVTRLQRTNRFAYRCTFSYGRFRGLHRRRGANAKCSVNGEGQWAKRAAVLVLAASPVVAIGHLTAGLLELTGGLLLTLGVWTVAILGWREAARSSGVPQVLLRIGAFAPVLPMLLALHYGLTRISDITPLGYNTIALIHGSLNALGFLAANLLAETLNPNRRPQLANASIFLGTSFLSYPREIMEEWMQRTTSGSSPS